jgi:hypothetical protein
MRAAYFAAIATAAVAMIAPRPRVAAQGWPAYCLMKECYPAGTTACVATLSTSTLPAIN